MAFLVRDKVKGLIGKAFLSKSDTGIFIEYVIYWNNGDVCTFSRQQLDMYTVKIAENEATEVLYGKSWQPNCRYKKVTKEDI